MHLRSALVVVCLLLSVAIGVVLSRSGRGAGGGTKTGGPLQIGLSMDTLKEERWQTDRDLFVARAAALGAEVLVTSANGDDTTQIRDVESLISRRVAAIVIIPHNGAVMAKAVDMAHQAGIPVIAYDRLITGCDLDLYITFDNVRVGELQAKFVADHLTGPGPHRIVRIYGSKTDNNAFLFKQGQDNVIQPLVERGALQVIHEDWAADWKPENAKKITNAAITRNGREFAAVLASNDGTAGGAIQALLEEGLAGKIMVTGQDAELAACQRIAAGTQAMTIYKPLKQLAERAAEAAVKMARGRPVVASSAIDNGRAKVPSILLDVVAVTRENLDATVIADGLHLREAMFPVGSASPQP
jgi:D-xylose transport system substrate-binding protein